MKPIGSPFSLVRRDPGETVAACDLSFIIPMAHGMDSLNAAAAAAVAFWVIAGSGV